MLDLAKGEDFALTFLEEFSQAGYQFGSPPAVLVELGYLAQGSPELETRQVADHALDCLGKWRIQCWAMKLVGDDIAKNFQRSLVFRGLLPEEEVADGIILAQTSLASIPVLVTSDHHLTDIDEAALRQAFEDCDLQPVAVMRARILAKMLLRQGRRR